MISGKWLIFQRSPLITNHSPLITNYGFIQLLPQRDIRSKYRGRPIGRPPSYPHSVDDKHIDTRYGSMRRASQTYRRCRWRICPSHNAGYQRGGKSDEYQYRLAQSGIHGTIGSRRTLQPQSSRCGGTICRKGTHQSGKLR